MIKSKQIHIRNHQDSLLYGMSEITKDFNTVNFAIICELKQGFKVAIFDPFTGFEHDREWMQNYSIVEGLEVAYPSGIKAIQALDTMLKKDYPDHRQLTSIKVYAPSGNDYRKLFYIGELKAQIQENCPPHWN